MIPTVAQLIATGIFSALAFYLGRRTTFLKFLRPSAETSAAWQINPSAETSAAWQTKK